MEGEIIMNKCDFCDLGNPQTCEKCYYTIQRENGCRIATIKMQKFLKELAENGATIHFN